MPLRLIEMVIPESRRSELEQLLKDQPVLSLWSDTLSEERILVKVLLSAENTEGVLDLLEKRFSMLEGFRAIILPVQASIPRPEPEEGPPEKPGLPKVKEAGTATGRMYREEVYSGIVDAIKFSKVMIVLVLLSSLVAAIGILYGNLPVIIGAMVIAPLLGPNVALSFATTLGDTNLARRALKANAVGILSALILPIILGLLLSSSINPDISEIKKRTSVGWGDIAIALVAGTVGGLAFTTGISTALVGVMVAVAILPPIVTSGLLIGAGYVSAALGSLLLLVTNLICVNLAGVLTFLAQGIQPKTWWEATKAKKATRQAILLWTLLLIALMVVIYLSRRPSIH